MTDVFKDGIPAEVGFWEQKEVGAKIQGTYIERVEIPAKGIYQPQIGYKLKTDSGIKIAAFNIAKKFVHDGMKQAKLGQKVGFHYESDFETEASKKDPNISAAKTIKVYLGEMDMAHMTEVVMGGTEVATPSDEIKVEDVDFEEKV